MKGKVRFITCEVSFSNVDSRITVPGILLTKLLSSAKVMMNILLNTYIEYPSDYSRGGRVS